MEVIVDTTTLSNFLLVDRLDILIGVVGKLCTTDKVIEEIKVCIARNIVPDIEFHQIEIFVQDRDDELLFSRLKGTFGKGEASCLAVCKSRGFKILTDDLDARKYAQRMGIPVSGTIGVLVSAANKGIISIQEANDVLSEMMDKGFYSPIKRLDELDMYEP